MLSKKFFLCVFFLSLGAVYASCSLSETSFQGSLSTAATDEDGFPTVLATSDDSLFEVFVSCDDLTNALFRVQSPIPMNDKVPIIKPSPYSFFEYRGKRYRDNQTVMIKSGTEKQLIRVGISVGDRKKVLPASTNYRYTISLDLIMNQAGP